LGKNLCLRIGVNRQNSTSGVRATDVIKPAADRQGNIQIGCNTTSRNADLARMRQPALICYFASGGQFSIERPQERVEFAVALWRDPGSHAHHTGGEGKGVKLVVLLA